MNSLKSVLFAAVVTLGVFSAGACSNTKAVKAMEDVADQLCACKPGDAKCLQDASKAIEETTQKLSGEKGTDGDKKKIEAANKRAQDCYAKLMGGATGGDAPKTDTK